MHYLLAFLIGVMVGLRTMTAPAVTSWFARAGSLRVSDTRMAFFESTVVALLFTCSAITEWIIDQLPNTPSRKAPMGFLARIVSGAVCGAALCAPIDALLPGLVAGAAGAVVGTLGGYELRMRLARHFGKDRPAAFLEDAVALLGSILILSLA